MAVRGYRSLHGLGVDRAGALIVARSEATGQRVVIRVLSPALAADRALMRELRPDINALRRLRHPNLVSLIAFDPRGSAVVCEYVDGTTLRHVLDLSGPLDITEALVLLDDCLAGLEALHAAHVCHRDVRPEVILISTSGTVLLRDAAVPVPALHAGWKAGTPQYMAPELWAGRAHSVATDLYATAAVFFEAVTGRPPYPATDLASLGYAHERGSIPDESLPPVARGLVTKGLAKDPRYRPRSAQQFRADVDAAARSFLGDEWRERGRAGLAELARARAADPLPPEPPPLPVLEDADDFLPVPAEPAGSAPRSSGGSRGRPGWRVWSAVLGAVLALLIVVVVAAHALTTPADQTQSPTTPALPLTSSSPSSVALPSTGASPSATDTASNPTQTPIPTEATPFPTSTQSLSFGTTAPSPTASPTGSSTGSPTACLSPLPLPTPSLCP